jgi:peptidoglycan/xylan/chitin deacetylase (PgdA/CDA1 family)
MLRGLKLSMLHASRALGLFRLVRDSGRRRQQLLILCYHGISIDDEHEWAPGLYMSQDAFASRLALLKRGRYVILPLADAVRRLHEGTLPARSVAITFDDGNFDFYSRAWPVLEMMGVPATVYLTTYYCDNNLPIFPLAVSYLMWKRRGILAALPVGSRQPLTIDTRSAEARRRTHDALLLHAQDEVLSGIEKDALAASLAAVLDIDYGPIRRRRLLHIMNPSEVRELAAAGVDFQLHTHRHRSPLDPQAYATEIADNRARITAYTGTTPTHFCYPSGVCMPEFAAWLEAQGVTSATTCEPGMATAATSRFELPRLLDHSEMTDVEFEAWLSGIGALLPRRPIGFQPVDREGRLVIPRPSNTGPVTVAAQHGVSDDGTRRETSMESVT